MAGFRRLCGRFCYGGGRTCRNEAEGAKFKRLRRLWGVVLIWWNGRQNDTVHAYVHASEGSVVGVFKGF